VGQVEEEPVHQIPGQGCAKLVQARQKRSEDDQGVSGEKKGTL